MKQADLSQLEANTAIPDYSELEKFPTSYQKRSSGQIYLPWFYEEADVWRHTTMAAPIKGHTVNSKQSTKRQHKVYLPVFI